MWAHYKTICHSLTYSYSSYTYVHIYIQCINIIIIMYKKMYKKNIQKKLSLKWLKRIWLVLEDWSVCSYRTVLFTLMVEPSFICLYTAKDSLFVHFTWFVEIGFIDLVRSTWLDVQLVCLPDWLNLFIWPDLLDIGWILFDWSVLSDWTNPVWLAWFTWLVEPFWMVWFPWLVEPYFLGLDTLNVLDWSGSL